MTGVSVLRSIMAWAGLRGQTASAKFTVVRLANDPDPGERGRAVPSASTTATAVWCAEADPSCQRRGCMVRQLGAGRDS